MPGRGDTVLIAPVGGVLSEANAGSITAGSPGALIDGVTLNLAGGTAGAHLILDHNVLGAGSVINTTGTDELWITNVNLFSGQINVGVGTPSTLRVDLFPATDFTPGNTTNADVNSGGITVGDGSELWLHPFTGGSPGSGVTNPNTGHYNFLNTGTVTVAPGGYLLDQSPSQSSGLYFTDFINDGLVNVLGAAGKTTKVQFDANVRSSTSFVNAYDTPLGKSIPASGNKQGVINLEGGTGLVSATFTGNESDQVIRAHNALVSSLAETSTQPRAWGGEIDLEGNAAVSLLPNYILYDYPIGAVAADPDYSKSLGIFLPVVHGFDSTDSLSVDQELFSYAGVKWSQSNHVLEIDEYLNSDHTGSASFLEFYVLDGDWQQSDFKTSYAANNSASGYWKVTTNDSHGPGAPLFDHACYLANNPDVAASGVDPYQHYLTTGWKEGRNPSALFNTNYYLAQNPGVKAAGINPLLHFEQTGWLEGRDPSAAFSVSRYEAAYPSVHDAGVNPLVDYLTGGQAAGRAALPVVAGAAPATKFQITDAATGTGGGDNGTAYTGPVAGVQSQYLWASPAGAAISASAPNVFLRGNSGDDALQVQGGTNVLDGGGSSTWSTIVNFHHGDSSTLFGFTDGKSTRPWTASDGAPGKQGATTHSELGGAGTGVNASVTFAGISLADALAKFTVTTSTVGGNPYLSIAHTG